MKVDHKFCEKCEKSEENWLCKINTKKKLSLAEEKKRKIGEK